jgi:hypothetical protein
LSLVGPNKLWTENTVDGDAKFMLKIKVNLGAKAVSYKIAGKNAYYELSDPRIPYSPLFTVQSAG